MRDERSVFVRLRACTQTGLLLCEMVCRASNYEDTKKVFFGVISGYLEAPFEQRIIIDIMPVIIEVQ